MVFRGLEGLGAPERLSRAGYVYKTSAGLFHRLLKVARVSERRVSEISKASKNPRGRTEKKKRYPLKAPRLPECGGNLARLPPHYLLLSLGERLCLGKEGVGGFRPPADSGCRVPILAV